MLVAGLATSCIEPPLKLPAEEVLVDMPIVQVDIDVVWNLDVDWRKNWHYGWDEIDEELWGDIEYPTPSNYEVRRYFLGNMPRVPHTTVDAFTVFNTRFRRTYDFGYYDMLIWSNIDSDDGTQVITIDESDINETTATTTVTRGLTRVISSTDTGTKGTTLLTGTSNSTVVTGLFNQPEIFYSAYPQDIFISREEKDYDYFDEAERCWVKRINCDLDPLVYMYLVQIIITNNEERIVTGCSGDNAISSFASGTSVNTGHTWNKPGMVYFGSRFKQDVMVEDYKADIIGGKFTTYGLCDMDSYSKTKAENSYSGSRLDLKNYLYVDLTFYNGAKATLQADVTEQCWSQPHGGIITVYINAKDLVIPKPDPSVGTGSLFVPTVEDYDEVIYDLVM